MRHIPLHKGLGLQTVTDEDMTHCFALVSFSLCPRWDARAITTLDKGWNRGEGFLALCMRNYSITPSVHAQTIKKTLYLEVVIALQLKSRCRRPLAITAVTWYGEQIVSKRSIARAKLLKQMLKINRYCWTEFVILNLCRWTFNCTWPDVRIENDWTW